MSSRSGKGIVKTMITYVDKITREVVLDASPSVRPLTVIIPGMLFSVQSKPMGFFTGMFESGWMSLDMYEELMAECGGDKTVPIDIEAGYNLLELDDFTVDDFEEYLKNYTQRLKDVCPNAENIKRLKDYIVPRIPQLRAYTGMASYDETNASTRGSIVFADRTKQPAFLYLEFGLTAITKTYKPPMEESGSFSEAIYIPSDNDDKKTSNV